MPFAPDPDTAIRVGWAGALLGVLIFVVSALGEFLGWWDLVGEIGMLVGSLLSIVAGFGTWFSAAGREQLASVGDEVGEVTRGVHGVRTVVEANGTRLASVDDKLGSLDKLDKLDKLDRLDKLDAIDSDLDEVQLQLDEQTGVLGRQVELLAEIRDGLDREGSAG